MTELLNQVQRALGDAFSIERELFGGGMSRLFVAIESSLNRRVVVKVLPPDLAGEVSAARFRREMEFVAQLQHPHIVPVLAAGAREGILYYVMPYVAGESLRVRMEREGALALDPAVRILAEVADALAYAHERGVIHRDIKPENILLEGKHAVLADFGVARAMLEARSAERLTGTGISVGTPGYMSPEQFAGDHVDARADVYALAIVGYEMLAGRPPFSGPTAAAVVAAHLTETPAPLQSVRPDAPQNVSAAIARALSKRPEDRFSSAAEFGEALVADRSQQNYRNRFVRDIRGIAIALLVIVLVAGAGYLFTRSRARTLALRAQLNPMADSARYDEVFRILDSAGVRLDARGLGDLASRVGGRLTITTEPAGATVSVLRVHPLATMGARRPRSLGSTPLRANTVVAGEYLISISHDDAEAIQFLAAVSPGQQVSVHRILNTDTARTGMTYVEGGKSPTGRSVASFFIDRTEVTNAQFQRFVSAGGYRDDRYWPDSLRIGGEYVSRSVGLRKFADRTGLPAPRYWSGATFPEGKADHPVVGVSWYEAAAFAEWAGKRLLTKDEWWRAALGEGDAPFPWGADGATIDSRANFGLIGTHEVGSHPAGVSPYGCYDMAGNAREWIASALDDTSRYFVLGGSWQDPSYMFELAHSEHFDPSFANEAIGFRLARSQPDLPPQKRESKQ